MSLLLEALRRAEKQSLGDRSMEGRHAEAENDATRMPLELEPVPRPASPAVPVAYDETSPGPQPMQGVARAESKGVNLPSPFHLALGLLSAVALSAVGYFWHQMQRAPQLALPGAAQPSPAKATVIAQPAPAPSALPGLPIDTPARSTDFAAATAPASPPAATRATAASGGETAARSAQPQPEAVIPAPREAVRIHPQVEEGFGALRKGDFDTARAAYQQVLREEPDNADAVLGLAALEAQTGRLDLARAHYLWRLDASPRDPYARAGLLALHGEQADPLQAESALRTLLAADPDAVPLNLSLGNQLARQGRWAEARQAYARALAGDPDHPDIAFNFAVSLDRLHRHAEAMVQYGRALALAERRFAAFSTEVARRRLEQLTR